MPSRFGKQEYLWGTFVPYGGTRKNLIYSRPGSKVWVEVSEGSSVRYIVRKYRETSEGSDRLVAEKTTNIWATDDSPRGALARKLGMPGAGWAMEVAEKLIHGKGR